VLNQKQLYKVLEFPKHLQVSLTTLLKIGSASAQQVAAATGKARAVESCYLNQLAIMRIVRKEHHGSTVFFRVDLEALDW
jgi:ribosomal protein S13